MTVLPGRCALHIAVDEDLSGGFDSLVSAAQHGGARDAATTSSSAAAAAHAALIASVPARTRVCGARQKNAVAQTVTLRLVHEPPTPPPGVAGTVTAGGCSDPRAAAGAPALAALTASTHVVVVLDAQQVPSMLSAATARRCPPHLSGAGPLAWYLDAVVDGVQQERESDETEGGGGGGGGVVHVSLLVLPNAAASLCGRNSTNVNVTAAEAAALFTAATAWGAARAAAAAAVPEADATAPHRVPVSPAKLDLCATATHAGQAVQMIAALGVKLLRVWATAASGAAESGGAAVDVRPDTQQKVVPSDFHALYRSMLMEVSSYSARKTMATMTVFPTMHHLLEHVDSVLTAAAAPAQDGGSAASDDAVAVAVAARAVSPVYSRNFGEGRAWRVLGDEVLEAIAAAYEPVG
ncbi:hypothetical protein NESM_000059900 [Novymonas esmeraldas]|uniref:Uncharacterized protein n=1 Tax=Novymonas esmeraldas TaxID=1808958 RepID=A0AAW0F1R4_9TRYP